MIFSKGRNKGKEVSGRKNGRPAFIGAKLLYNQCLYKFDGLTDLVKRVSNGGQERLRPTASKLLKKNYQNGKSKGKF